MSLETSHDETVADIEETLGFVPGFMQGLPEEDLVREWPTFKTYVLGETEIPPKYRELAGLAVAANTKCPYCVHFHRGAAQLHGAGEDELREMTVLSGVTARWSSMIHAQEYDMDRFVDETERIAEHLQGAAGAADD